MRKIFCDRCGKDITDEEKIGSAVFRWKYQEGHFIVSEAAVGYDSDYCPACMELMTTVASKVEAVGKTKPKKKAAAAAADQDTENEPKKPAKKRMGRQKGADRYRQNRSIVQKPLDPGADCGRHEAPD